MQPVQIVQASYRQQDWYQAAGPSLRTNNNVTLRVDIDGQLYSDALTSALHRITKRHPVLRTSLQQDSTRLNACIQDTIKVPLTIHGTITQTDLEKLAIDARDRYYDLSNPPLWSAHLAQLSPTRPVLMWSFHHGVVDGVSAITLLDELAQLYHGIAHGRHISLRRDPDYYGWASHERAIRCGEHLRYWTQQITPRIPELGGDWPPGQSAQLVPCPLPHISHADIAALKQAERHAVVSPGVALIAVALAVLGRETDRCTIGIARTNRENPLTTGIVGPVFDHLPLTVVAPHRDSFVAFLSTVGNAWQQAKQHRVPTAALEDELSGHFAPRRFFDAVVNVGGLAPWSMSGNINLKLGAAPSVVGASITVAQQTSVTPRLGFILDETQHGLTGTIWGLDLFFTPDDLNAYAERFAFTLKTLAHAPNTPIDDLLTPPRSHVTN
jgi:hypothetical protein